MTLCCHFFSQASIPRLSTGDDNSTHHVGSCRNLDLPTTLCRSSVLLNWIEIYVHTPKLGHCFLRTEFLTKLFETHGNYQAQKDTAIISDFNVSMNSTYFTKKTTARSLRSKEINYTLCLPISLARIWLFSISEKPDKCSQYNYSSFIVIIIVVIWFFFIF